METRIETRMIDANGLTFEVDECGSGPKFALLLHGFPESKYSWRYQIPLLEKLGYRVWAPNLRGYGKTSKPEGVMAYHIDRLVDDVAALIDAAGAKETLLVGHDWGAVIAWEVAIRRTRPLERLIIMNVPHPACFLREIRTWDQLRRSWYMFAFQLPFLPERALLANDAEAVARAFVGMAVDRSRFPKEVTDEYRRSAQEPGAATAMVNYYRALMRAAPSVVKRDFGIVDVPTLMIWGASDKALSNATTNGTDRYVKDLTLRLLPNVSHWVQQEAPEKVNAMVEAWLSGNEVPRS
ncbi:MAG: alpha/beta hydrolase [Polyangiaceae bacterium]|nr:alpha/beta hydrolase [Polyangiaceae bacterium]